MIALIQRVTSAKVSVGKEYNQIGEGLLVLLGMVDTDDEEVTEKTVNKLLKLRVFADEEGKMNRSILETEKDLLVVSQFTLVADMSAGNRPSFAHAADPKRARSLYNYFVKLCQGKNIKTKQGFFGEYMSVELTNDGPVTIILDSEKL